MVVLVVANTLLAAASAVFAVIAVVRPSALAGSPASPAGTALPGPSEVGFFAAMYAGRAIPLSVLLTWTLVTDASPSTRLAVLLAAAAAQAVDATLAWRRHNRGMLVSAAVAFGIHLASAIVLAAGTG